MNCDDSSGSITYNVTCPSNIVWYYQNDGKTLLMHQIDGENQGNSLICLVP